MNEATIWVKNPLAIYATNSNGKNLKTESTKVTRE